MKKCLSLIASKNKAERLTTLTTLTSLYKSDIQNSEAFEKACPLNHSHSTKPNQFCLEIILCRIHGAFDYLIYPYYPAYTG